MMDVLFAGESLPFVVALILMALIGLLELIGTLIGLAPSHAVDSMLPDLHADTPHLPDHDGFLGSALEWLAVGRVPLIVLIIAFLTSFGISGLMIERAAFGLTGHFIPALIASVGAFLLALPLTRFLGLALARVLPKDETEAVSLASFIGKVAVVTAGTADRGLAAEAKLTDSFGKSHYIRVEPDIDGETFATGAQVLIVAHAGHLFRVIAAKHPALTTSESGQ